jgi:hypothetical protein
MRHFLDQSEQRGVRQRWLHTFTFITGEPNEFLSEIYTRMRVILPEEDTMLGYLVKPVKRFWFLTRRTE